MLTKYKNPPQPVSGNRARTKTKKTDNTPPPENGTRKEGTDFFNSIRVKAALLPAAVHLTYGVGLGSGVILGAAKGKAYILTAKHVLWTLLDQDAPENPPSEYDMSKYPQNIRIHYDPADIKGAPRQQATVTGISFADVADSEKNWTYDAVLMESQDQTFVDFVKDHRFIKPTEIWRYSKGLPEQDGDFALLSARDYKFIQLGFGKPKDTTVTLTGPEVDNYENCEGRLQCKISNPTANTPAPDNLVSPDKNKDRTEWQTVSHAIELTADNTCSTAPGDSGGPLFSVTNDLKEFYLVGVTTGANYYADETSRQESKINNNVATYWEPMFEYCNETFLHGED